MRDSYTSNEKQYLDIGQLVMVHARRRQRQANLYKLQARLLYRVNPRTGSKAEKPCLNPPALPQKHQNRKSRTILSRYHMLSNEKQVPEMGYLSRWPVESHRLPSIIGYCQYYWLSSRTGC